MDSNLGLRMDSSPVQKKAKISAGQVQQKNLSAGSLAAAAQMLFPGASFIPSTTGASTIPTSAFGLIPGKASLDS